ncbi:MAG: hypothetical protein L0215_10225 [Gemmataceae bacterium]|nr:hypothetical protein [Gemmataceae bacterium]
MLRLHFLLLLGLCWLGPAGGSWAQDDTKNNGAKKKSEVREPDFRLGAARFANFGRVFGVAFSPDGKQVAAGAWDGTIAIWDVDKQKPLREWEGHEGAVRALAYSSAGILASTGKDNQIRLWDAATGKSRQAFAWVGQDDPTFVQFNPNGRFLCASGWWSLAVWDLEKGTVVFQREGRKRPHSVFGQCRPCFVTGGDWLYWSTRTTDEDRTTFAFHQADPRTWKERPPALQVIDRFGAGVDCIAPTGRWYARSMANGTLALGTVSSFNERPLLELQRRAHRMTLVFSPDERILALQAAELDKEVTEIWLVETCTGQIRARLKATEYSIFPPSFSSDCKLLACGDLDRSVLVWKVLDPGKVKKKPETRADVEFLWKTLKELDGAAAHRAMESLVANPQVSAAFLAEKLKPQPHPQEDQIRKLLQDLGNDQFAVRSRAFAELEKLHDGVETALKKSLESATSLEFRRRLESLLQRIDAWWQEQFPSLRALEILERIGDGPALDGIRRLAAGAPGSRVSQEAQLVLGRLSRTNR